MKSISTYTIYILTCLALAATAFTASAAAPPPLPPAAEEALNKGIIAAKVPDYLLAIRFFQEARKLAPQAPVIYLNLGLAESRIPGRELRAIAWFGAYLSAYPDAPNAAVVKEQIAVLDVKKQSNISRLIKAIQDIADQIPENTTPPNDMGSDKEHILYQVSSLWAAIGDIERAQKTAGFITRSDTWKSFAYGAIAGAQLVAGDIAGASRTTGRIPDTDKRSAIQKTIAEDVAKTQPASTSAVAVDDWLTELGVGSRSWIVGPLTADMFLDLEGHLKSLPPPSKDIYAHFWALEETASKAVRAQKEIDEMLKRQTRKL